MDEVASAVGIAAIVDEGEVVERPRRSAVGGTVGASVARVDIPDLAVGTADGDGDGGGADQIVGIALDAVDAVVADGVGEAVRALEPGLREIGEGTAVGPVSDQGNLPAIAGGEG